MGCDIHSYVEVKQDGRWVAPGNVFESDHRRDMDGWKSTEAYEFFGGQSYRYAPSPIDARNYALFRFLAGVRGIGPTCLDLIGTRTPTLLRGVPDDVGSYVNSEYLYDVPDAHSSHWLTLQELVAGNMAAAMHDPNYRYYKEQLDFTLEQLLAYADDHQLSHDDIRVVFWFDN